MPRSVMCSNGFLLTIELRAVSPGRLAFGYLLLVGPALLLALTAVAVPFWAWALLLATAMLACLHGGSVVSVSWPASGVAALRTADGLVLRASLQRAWLVGPLAGLLWRTDCARSVGMLLWRGDQSADAWRLMRVRVLLGVPDAGEARK